MDLVVDSDQICELLSHMAFGLNFHPTMSYINFNLHFLQLLFFFQVDKSDLTLQRSGNPGYVDGQSVLAGSVSEEYPFIFLYMCYIT